jgi:Protein of unknown function (DUF3562)
MLAAAALGRAQTFRRQTINDPLRAESARCAHRRERLETVQMSHAISLERTQANADDPTVDAIARETAAPADMVRALYEEETASLNAQARLKQFVPVIVINRVKQRLRRLSQRPR